MNASHSRTLSDRYTNYPPMPFLGMDDATARQVARRMLWGLAVVPVGLLIAAGQAVELWSIYWWSPYRTIAGLALGAVVVVLFTAVHMLSRP